MPETDPAPASTPEPATKDTDRELVEEFLRATSALLRAPVRARVVDIDEDVVIISTTTKRSRKFADLAAAMAAAASEFKPIERDKTANVHSQRTGKSFSYKYADLASVLAATTPALSKNGLALFTPVSVDPNFRHVVAHVMLMHTTGQWIQHDHQAAIADESRDARVVGSAETYARRYGVQALLGIATEDDDDGESAAGGAELKRIDEHPNAPRQQQQQPPRDTRDSRQQPPKQDPPKQPEQPKQDPPKTTPFQHDFSNTEPDGFWDQLMSGVELTKNVATKGWKAEDFYEWWDRELQACSTTKAMTAYSGYLTEFRKAGAKSEYCKAAAAKMSAMYSARDKEIRDGGGGR